MRIMRFHASDGFRLGVLAGDTVADLNELRFGCATRSSRSAADGPGCHGGDVIEVEIEGIGVLRNSVVDEASISESRSEASAQATA
jgi:hypothetical protein